MYRVVTDVDEAWELRQAGLLWWADHEGSVTWYPAVTRTKEDHTSMFLVSGNTYAVLVEDEGDG
jgi:hypothetical protein